MRSLIRPFLFTSARLGLFLAVTMWIAGQWWYVLLASPRCTAELLPTGVSFSWRTVAGEWKTWARPTPFPEYGEARFEYPWIELGIVTTGGFSFPGGALLKYPAATFLSFGHWFNVTVFALFYAVLKRAYRKQTVVEPAEEQLVDV